MADQQVGSNPPEIDDPMADARAAYAEVAGREAAAEPVDAPSTPEPKAEPEVKAEPEPKADHPTDERRYADGTFKQAAPKAEPKAEVKAEPVQAEPQAAAAAVPAAVSGPPGGFSVKSKADWEKITAAYPHLAADIAKREKEVADGFAQYDGMRELRPYVEMARQRGQSLKSALDNYIGIENALRNPQQALNAILHVAGGAGYSPQRLAAELAPYVGPSTGQQDAPQNGAQLPFDPSMLQQWLNPLAQKISTIESHFQQQAETQRTRTVSAISTAVERFKSVPEHRYYDNVEPQMTQLIESGVVPNTGDYAADLQAAYDMACWQNPEIRELLLNERIANTEAARVKAEKEAGEKARQASRSITGSSSNVVRETDDGQGNSPHDDARRAYREVTARV